MIANFSSLSYTDLSFDPALGAYVCRGSEMDRFVAAMNDSLSLPIEEMLRSENAIIRALAMLDRRFGKRRLRTLTLAEDELPLVRTLYALRRESEGLTEP